VNTAAVSYVLQRAVPSREQMLEHLEFQLSAYADPADVFHDLEQGVKGFVVVDARNARAFERGHVPGAISLPHSQMSEATTRELSKDLVYIVYCDGIGCNASTHGAYKLTRLGFKAKEMIGGLDFWVRDGYAVAGGPQESATCDIVEACGCHG
jgi:rhodanese-related sulfurtransferase